VEYIGTVARGQLHVLTERMGQSDWVSGGSFVSFMSTSRDAKVGHDGDCG